MDGDGKDSHVNDLRAFTFGFNYIYSFWLMRGVLVCLVFRHFCFIKCQVECQELHSHNYDLDADVNTIS